MKSSPSRSTRDPASPSFLSLSTLLFLRGGQHDADTVTSDETASVDTDVHMQRQYGTAAAPEPSSSDATAATADVEGGRGSETSHGSVTPSPPSPFPPLLAALAPATATVRAASAVYLQQLTRRPVLTKSLTAGVIFGLSDWCAQAIERGGSADAVGERAPLVYSRLLTAFLVGLLFFGPAANAWYGMVFRVLPSTSLASTLQKAALGQIFFGPAFNCVFFGAGLVQSGDFSLGAWARKIRADLPRVWASGVGFWPVVDFISFKVVPVQWIPLFVNFCSFVWTIYLSLVANRAKGAEG